MPERSDTREALLDAAERLFSDRGYAGVGIRELADAAGVNLAAINYHFGSKSNLYLETVRRAMRRPESPDPWSLLEGPFEAPQDAAVALAKFIHGLLHRILPTSAVDRAGCFILHEAFEPSEAIDSIVRDFIEPHEAMLMRVIAQIIPDADDRRLALVARGVLGQLLHYRTFRPFFERLPQTCLDRPESLGEIADHVVRFSLRGMGCEEPMIEHAAATGASHALRASHEKKAAPPLSRPARLEESTT